MNPTFYICSLGAIIVIAAFFADPTNEMFMNRRGGLDFWMPITGNTYPRTKDTFSTDAV